MEAETSKEPSAGPSEALAEAEKNGRDLTETTVSSETIFDGVVLHVFKDTVSLPDGRTSTREFLRHLGAVCVVPVTADGKIVVERQYRYAVGQTMVEIPAGKLDYKGEDRLEAAKRELREETGYTADRWTDLGTYLTAPAFSDENISMYMAEGLHKGDQDLDDDEFLDVVEVPLEELVADVMAGRITDAKTQTGILKAAAILNARL
ncbi:MAG: NUDIX hydrolase [Clostridia bacterium]|nr:NUDIX hydrolase [Clostridia bacterium]